MKFLDNIICPISTVKVDRTLSRLTVFINVILMALYLLTGVPYFMILVAIDYGIRAFWQSKYSLIQWAAMGIKKLTGLPEKQVDQAPKLFASRVGLLFAAGSMVLLLFQNPLGSSMVAGVLFVFAILDSVFDFCVGCLTYHYVVLSLYQRRMRLR